MKTPCGDVEEHSAQFPTCSRTPKVFLTEQIAMIPAFTDSHDFQGRTRVSRKRPCLSPVLHVLFPVKSPEGGCHWEPHSVLCVGEEMTSWRREEALSF